MQIMNKDTETFKKILGTEEYKRQKAEYMKEYMKKQAEQYH